MVRVTKVVCSALLSSCILVCTATTFGQPAVPADSSVADGAEPGAEFRRVFVPADAPETWPVGSERFLPIDRQQLSQLTKRATQHDEGHPAQSRITSGTYHVELRSADVLSVSAEYAIEVYVQQPQLVSLSPLNLTIEEATWKRDPDSRALLGLWKQADDKLLLAVQAERSDSFTIQGLLGTDSQQSGYRDFFLEIPTIVPQTLEIALPPNHTATLSHSARVSKSYGPLGESIWKFQLAPHEVHRLRIRDLSRQESQSKPPLASQSTSYEIKPSGLDFTTELRLESRERRPLELSVKLPARTQVVEVTLDDEVIEWRVEEVDGLPSLVMRLPSSVQPQSLRVRCLASLRAKSDWVLPKLQFDEIAWTEGTSRLVVSPKLELTSLEPRQCSLQHIVGIADEQTEGEVYRLQEWSQDATVQIEVARPEPQLRVQTTSTVEQQRDEAQLRVLAKLSVAESSLYQAQAMVAPGWQIESVSSKSSDALSQWHTSTSAGSTKLNLRWSRPITADRPRLVEIVARQIASGSIIPAQVAKIRLLRFVNFRTTNELLELRNQQSQPIVLPSRLERASLDQSVAANLLAEFGDSFDQAPSGILLDLSILDDHEIIELGRQPARYRATVNTEIRAKSDSFEQQYDIEGLVTSGAVTDLILEASSPLPEDLQWKMAGQSTPVAVEKIKSGQRAGNEPTRYSLSLPEPTTKTFRLSATYSRSAQSIETCPLIRIPQAFDWEERVLVRGDLHRFRVLDQGLTPAVPALWETQGSDLPVLGVYRIGPEDFLRGDQVATLQLKRVTTDELQMPLVAWSAEYQTLQAANGAALHAANYLLERLGARQAEIELPADAQLQEAWINDRQLDLGNVFSNNNVYSFALEGQGQWHHLGIKYSTRDEALGVSAVIEPSLPVCSFPVNSSRWTLWAPEQYEIDNSTQSYSTQRYHWWKRMFGPLARSRDEKIFNPVSKTRWQELWSAPLSVQQSKQLSGSLMQRLTKQIEAEPSRTLSDLLIELTVDEKLARLFRVDRAALSARGITSTTTCDQLSDNLLASNTNVVRAKPLSSYQLALVASPSAIVLTSSERVAHWYDQLRPTRVPGLFLVIADGLSETMQRIRSADVLEFVSAKEWASGSLSKQMAWSRTGATMLVDVGRQAKTVEFVQHCPQIIVRRAHVQTAMWYVIVFLTIVIGVWQLGHFPNVMIFVGALAGAACLLVPIHWLTIPQAVFLGLLAAAIVRVVLKSSQFAEERLQTHQVLKSTTATVVLLALSLDGSAMSAQPATNAVTEQPSRSSLPRVLVPIDADGERQGDEVYLSESHLKLLQQASRRESSEAEIVILDAIYSGRLPAEADTTTKTGEALATSWNLSYRIETQLPNRRLVLPLRQDDAVWATADHRLDGLPCRLRWQPDGNGCSLMIAEPGSHRLNIVCHPRISSLAGSHRLRLHLPSAPGATLKLVDAKEWHDLHVPKAVLLANREDDNSERWILDPRPLLEVQWDTKAEDSTAKLWQKLDQLSWLTISPRSARVDVQLHLTEKQKAMQTLDLQLSSQLALLDLPVDSPIADVVTPDPSQPNRIRVKLRAGLPADVVLPLSFELKRSVSLGQIYFPEVKVVGSKVDSQMFAVSVSAGLSYEENTASEMSIVNPADFVEAWQGASDEPLFVYKLKQATPDWSLRVWPDPQALNVRQSLRVECSPRRVDVDYEADVVALTGDQLMHKLVVPKFLAIDAITVRDQMTGTQLPLRWSRASSSLVSVFLNRPLSQPYLLALRGHLEISSEDQFDLPQVHWAGSKRGEIHMDLYRSEEALVEWVDRSRVPKQIEGRKIPRNVEEIHLGHFLWRTSQIDELSKLSVRVNQQEFRTQSVTSIESDDDKWIARLSSRIAVREGVVSRLRLIAPEEFQNPLKLVPEQLAVIDEETSGSSEEREIVVRLARPISAGEEIELQVTGELSLPADDSLIVPSLRWRDANQEKCYLLLPTLVEGQAISWERSGLRRQALPASLAEIAPLKNPAQCFRVMQNEFVAKQQNSRGIMRNAQIRHAQVSGVVDASGVLTATAEFFIQPGRTTSCSIQLPADSELRQLVVGDQLARREVQANETWKIPLGPPFLPQRVLVSYQTKADVGSEQLQLTPPRIILAGQALPVPQVWWKIRTPDALNLHAPRLGVPKSRADYLESSYQAAAQVVQDAITQTLDLPESERRTWVSFWNAVGNRTLDNLPTSARMRAEGADGESQAELTDEADVAARESMIDERVKELAYPPTELISLRASLGEGEYYFVSDLDGHIVVPITRGSRDQLWQWFAALALVSGVLTIVLRLRHHPECYHDLCHWPHSLALAGGFTWWILLRPSALGLLVMGLAVLSLAMKRWRAFRREQRSHANSRVVLSAS